MENAYNITRNSIRLRHNVACTNSNETVIVDNSANIMKPYRRSNKAFMVELRTASRLGRLCVLAREFAGDVRSLWQYGAPFPTFLKLIGTLILCLLVILPLVYPVFVIVVTYFTYESLYLSWKFDQPWLFTPTAIGRRVVAATFRPANIYDIWKVRDVLTRGILLAHSLATSVDYLCVMQGLLDEA